MLIRSSRTHSLDREHLKEVIFDLRKQEMSFNDYVDDLANTWHAQDVTSVTLVLSLSLSTSLHFTFQNVVEAALAKLIDAEELFEDRLRKVNAASDMST